MVAQADFPLANRGSRKRPPTIEANAAYTGPSSASRLRRARPSVADDALCSRDPTVRLSRSGLSSKENLVRTSGFGPVPEGGPGREKVSSVRSGAYGDAKVRRALC
jgi:hypothetical protein